MKTLEVKTLLRCTPGCAVLLLVLASACSSGDGADTSPTSSPGSVADTTSTSSPVTVEAKGGESPLEGEWYDTNGSKMLVVRGDTAEFFHSRGAVTIDTDADPNQITLPPEAGQEPLTTIFRVDDGRLEVVVLMDPTAPLPESIEAAAGDPESYSVLELFRGDVVFPSGVWTPAGHGLPPLYNVHDMTGSGDTLLVASATSDRALFISTDSGASWSQVGGGFPAEESVQALTTLEGRVFAGTQGRGVFISDDGGVTWTASNEGLAAPDADCAENPGTPHSQIRDIAGFGSTVFAASFCGVSRSDDLGETWRQLNEGLVGSLNVGFVAVGAGVAIAASQEHVLFRLDWENDRWEPFGQEIGFATALVESEGALLLGSPNSGVWRSLDSGESWTDVTDPRFNGVSGLVVVEGSIFAATPQGVFRSEDTGSSWTPYNKDLVRHLSLLLVSGDRLFAAGGWPGVFSAPFPDQLPTQESAAVIPGEVPEGFEAFDGSANGFTIALPATWLTIDLTVGDKDSIAAQLETIFPPDVAETFSSSYMQSRKTAASGVGGMVMAAFDPTGNPNVTVTVFPRDVGGTLESAEESTREGIELSGGSVQSVDRLELSGREASRIVTLFSFETNDVELVQYIVLGDDITYNITFNSSEPGTTDTLLSQVINTFALADP